MNITHIDDVLPHIEGRSEFVIKRTPDYTVIDYQYVTDGTFDHPARRECRGIKFAPDGGVLARPFHKFFNIGEVPETRVESIDFGQPHSIMEKLDGSMIHPAIVDDEVVFMTRMGRTDHARRCEARHLTATVRGGCEWAGSMGVTLIFEWTAPDNRIVIGYADSRLTLLAARWNASGRYMSRVDLAAWARRLGVRLVEEHPSTWADPQVFRDYARAVTGAEGFVVRFADGLMLKAKGDDYVLKHRTKDGISREKDVLALVMTGGLDDVLPLLDAHDRATVEAYRDAVLAGVEQTTNALVGRLMGTRHMAQKEFALGNTGPLRSVAFTARTGIAPRDAVVAAIMKGTLRNDGPDKVRHLHGARYGEAANDNSTQSEAA